MYLIFTQNAIGASGFTFSKILVGAISPFTFVMIRLLLSAGVSFSLAYANDQWKPVARGHKRLFAAASFLGFFVSFCGGAITAQVLSSAISSMFFNAVPFITAILAFVLFGERLSPKKLVAIGIGCLGLIPCVMEASSSLATVSVVPLIITFFTVAGYAYGWLMVKELVQIGYAPAFVTGVTQLLAGLAAIPFSVYIEQCDMQLNAFVAGMVCALVLSTALSALLYSLLLKSYSPTLLSFAGTLMPCFAALYGWLFLGERITALLLISGVMITIGLYLFYRAEMSDVSKQSQLKKDVV